jgi:bifunctional DNA-binding transcriptional regulator/antitoxin component of YhaV-PrlF toxin-antitoxin module
LPDEELIPLSIRKVSRKGGSLSITIPIEVVKMLNLEPDDSIIFLYDKNKKQVIINKVISTYTTPSGLSFSISKELAKKLLKEEEKRK